MKRSPFAQGEKGSAGITVLTSAELSGEGRGMTASVDPMLRQQFLGGMSNAACTVNVVTTDGSAGRAGVTVSAMSSVSADTAKPTLLVCVHHQSQAAEAIRENGVFCVNVLRDDQSYISDTFAGRFKGEFEDKFDCAEWSVQTTGAPRVVDPLVAFDCRLVHHDRVGTHYVFYGQVEDIFVAESGSPLIYANRAYGVASRIEAAPTAKARAESAVGTLSIGCLHTFGPYILPQLISRLQGDHGTLDLRLVEGDQRRVLESLLTRECELALVYDLDLAEGLRRERLTELTPYVLLAEGHALAHRSELTLQDLAEEPMVLLNAPPSREYFLSIMRDAGIEPKVAFRSTSFEMVRGLVGHGLGYALLATKPAAAMTYDGRALAARPLAVDAASNPVVLAYRADGNLSVLARHFARLCRDVFAAAD